MHSGRSDIFVWGSQFETGIIELDRQHRHLVDLINSLGRILVSEILESFEESLSAEKNNIDRLLAAANHALYRAKRCGRNCVIRA